MRVTFVLRLAKHCSFRCDSLIGYLSDNKADHDQIALRMKTFYSSSPLIEEENLSVSGERNVLSGRLAQELCGSPS